MLAAGLVKYHKWVPNARNQSRLSQVLTVNSVPGQTGFPKKRRKILLLKSVHDAANSFCFNLQTLLAAKPVKNWTLFTSDEFEPSQAGQ